MMYQTQPAAAISSQENICKPSSAIKQFEKMQNNMANKGTIFKVIKKQPVEKTNDHFLKAHKKMFLMSERKI